MSRPLLAVVCFVLLITAGPAGADSWMRRDHLIEVSPDGRFYVAIAGSGYTLAERVAEGQWQAPATLTIERVDVEVDGRRRQVRVPVVDPADRIIGQGRLAHEPLRAHVLSGGLGLVLFERFGGMGSGSVLTRIDATGHQRFAWTLADLFEPHVIAAFSRSVSSIHWSRGWWVDEVDGVVGLAYGGTVLGLPRLVELAGAGFLGVPLDGSAPGPLAESALRRETRSSTSALGLEILDAVIHRDSPDLDAWLAEAQADEAASLRVRMRAEAALWLRGGTPPLRLIESTWLETGVGDSLRSDAISLLGLARGAAVLPQLQQIAVEGPKADRAAALAAIESLGDRAEGPALSRLLADEGARMDVRAAAARGLGRTGDAELVAPLLDRAARAEPVLAGALFGAVASLPGGPPALEAWVLAEPTRANTVMRALVKSPDPASVTLIDRLARQGLAESGAVMPALIGKGEAGARAAVALLGDGVGAAGPYVEWLSQAPRPDAGEALLATVDRAKAGAEPDPTLARALHESLGPLGRGPVVERLLAGHVADGTLLLALQLPHSDIDPLESEAVLAAVTRHADPEDPALPVVAQAGFQTRRPDVAEALAPLLVGALPEGAARSIAMLLRHTPDVAATEPLLSALDRWRDDRFVCGLMAEALAVRPIEGATEKRLLRFIRSDGAVCAAKVVAQAPNPRITKALSDWLVARPMVEEHYAVVGALAKSGDPQAIPGLEVGLQGAHSGPVRSAAQALKKLGEPGLLALGRGLESGTSFDLSPLAALNEAKDPLPAGVLVGVEAALARADALAETDTPDPKAPERVRRMALLVLAKLDVDVVPELIGRLESGTGSIKSIAQQLIGLKDLRAADALLGVLDRAEGEERNAVLAALATIPGPDVIALLCEELLATEAGSREEGFAVNLLRTALPDAERPVGDRSRTSRAEAWREYARAQLP